MLPFSKLQQREHRGWFQQSGPCTHSPILNVCIRISAFGRLIDQRKWGTFKCWVSSHGQRSSATFQMARREYGSRRSSLLTQAAIIAFCLKVLLWNDGTSANAAWQMHWKIWFYLGAVPSTVSRICMNKFCWEQGRIKKKNGGRLRGVLEPVLTNLAGARRENIKTGILIFLMAAGQG